MMRLALGLIVVVLALSGGDPGDAAPCCDDEAAATCKGADPCNACKNCKACKYCKGGSCGTCRK